MVVGKERVPLLARREHHALAHHTVLERAPHALSPKRVHTRVARVGEDVVHRPVGRRHPPHLPVTRPPARQLTLFGDQAQHRLAGAGELVEVGEHRPDRVRDGLVRGDPNLTQLVVVQPGRERQAQLALGRLVQRTLTHPRAQHVQLGLGHRPLQPQEQPVVVKPGVIDTVGVSDQRVGQSAQVEQPIPVGIAPGQAGDLDSQDDPDFPQADIGHQPLEALAPVRALGRQPEITVDHDDVARGPAEGDGAVDKLILTLQALGVSLDLRQRRLADVHICRTTQVRSLNLSSHCSPSSPPVTARPIAAASNRRTRSRAPALIVSHTCFTPLPSPTGRASWGGVDFNPRTWVRLLELVGLLGR